MDCGAGVVEFPEIASGGFVALQRFTGGSQNTAGSPQQFEARLAKLC
jgi:hypothetical protein